LNIGKKKKKYQGESYKRSQTFSIRCELTITSCNTQTHVCQCLTSERKEEKKEKENDLTYKSYAVNSTQKRCYVFCSKI